MTRHDDQFYIEGIHEHVQAIRDYLPKTKQEFLADEKSFDAILMWLLALGEEISRLSDEFLEKHSDVRLFEIVGLRNRIAHGYFEVDKDIVWNILTDGSLDDLNKL